MILSLVPSSSPRIHLHVHTHTHTPTHPVNPAAARLCVLLHFYNLLNPRQTTGFPSSHFPNCSTVQTVQSHRFSTWRSPASEVELDPLNQNDETLGRRRRAARPPRRRRRFSLLWWGRVSTLTSFLFECVDEGNSNSSVNRTVHIMSYILDTVHSGTELEQVFRNALTLMKCSLTPRWVMTCVCV